MFWGKDKNKKSKQKKADKRSGKKKSCVEKAGQCDESVDIRAQALANARIARQNIGEDAIAKFAEMMADKENSALEKAKRQIQSVDKGRVLDEIKFMMDDR